VELRRERVLLEQVLTEAIETIQPQIDGAGHKLNVLLPAVRLVVDGDRARLGQAFMNLLSNAAKYTDPGGQLEVRVVSEGATALVSFRDSGIGIAPDRLEQVFEMFSQEEPALSRARGGLGIGLALTRKLVELHGGTVQASSEGPGKGSVFMVRLPLVDAAAQPVSEPAAQEMALPAGTLRILVADDNTDAAETLTILLESMGHVVRQAHDGAAAVRVAAEFDAQLALLDIGMPNMNGYEACRQIRAQPGGRGRTLVAVTGWGQPQDLERAREAGFDRHLVKPVDMERLLQLISARLEGNAQAGH
jgi:CheY-like chemotaxis protein/two-component sensor histidine kinase